ncbi:hypothetical protein ZIOFF_039348 [Zingiber officinale]|uniref:Protein FAR1-RELATED SEQUENCE n=1 Tax=Zingiber officinale TaxID=94328 RepID=A0A8J5GBC9_ZINOF|nr:hypothetical protein ZIOFF_039348 [Zingiber officinale]
MATSTSALFLCDVNEIHSGHNLFVTCPNSLLPLATSSPPSCRGNFSLPCQLLFSLPCPNFFESAAAASPASLKQQQLPPLSHVIKVLMRMKVIEVPMSYIMDRWRKDIKCGYQSISNIYDDYGCDGERLRYNTLTPLMQEVQQLGAENDDICSVLVEIIKDTKEKLIVAMENGQSMVEQFEEASTSGEKVIHSPLKVRTKGRPPIKRKQSKVEQIVKKSIAKARKKGRENRKLQGRELLLQRGGRSGCGALTKIRAGEGEEKTTEEGVAAASARGEKRLWRFRRS